MGRRDWGLDCQLGFNGPWGQSSLWNQLKCKVDDQMRKVQRVRKVWHLVSINQKLSSLVYKEKNWTFRLEKEKKKKKGKRRKRRSKLMWRGERVGVSFLILSQLSSLFSSQNVGSGRKQFSPNPPPSRESTPSKTPTKHMHSTIFSHIFSSHHKSSHFSLQLINP